MLTRLFIAVTLCLSASALARAEDWPQWRGPQGQGTTSATHLPPLAGSDSLKVQWKSPIPGEGCSSPIVFKGRVYLTTAYEGTERHALDQPAQWASIALTICVLGLTLAQLLRTVRAVAERPALMSVLGPWTIAVLVLATVVVAKPTWFWQYADPWTGTTVAPAELPWVESLSLRPLIVLAFGSLVLIYITLSGKPLLTSWLELVTFTVTLLGCGALGWIGTQPESIFAPGQPWLAWHVAGGLALFAFAGSVGWLDGGKLRWLAIVAGIACAGWLFYSTPNDEFGHAISLQNRIVYLVPALVLLGFHAWASSQPDAKRSVVRTSLFVLIMFLSIIVFARANLLQPQSGIVRAVVCLDARDGHMLWTTPVFVAPTEKRHSLNSLATPTPACDDERVYAYFGSGLAALDKNGRVLWLKRDDKFAGHIRYGAGSSVALADDKILVYRDSEFMGHGDHLDDDFKSQTARRDSALIAYDKKNGNIFWSITPPFSHDSYMTPLVWEHRGEEEVVIATWKTLASFSVLDGKARWTHPHPMQQIVPSLAVNGDCLVVTGGNVLPGPIMAVRAPSRGEAAQTLWFNGKTGGNIVSPVCWDGLLFSTSHLGVLTCRDAETGQIHWTKRLGSRCLASLVAGDGKVYALDQEGTLNVFAAEVAEKLMATYAFDEPCAATPAVAAKSIFVRTARHLYCVGNDASVRGP